MYFSNVGKIRGVLFVIVMIGIFVFQPGWGIANAAKVFLNFNLAKVFSYLIPGAALALIINEIVYAFYLSQSFDKVHAEVILREETSVNNLPVKHYDLKFEYHGRTSMVHFSESLLSNNLSGVRNCFVLIHKRAPHEVFIDGFKLRYMNLVFALGIAVVVYYNYIAPIRPIF